LIIIKSWLFDDLYDLYDEYDLYYKYDKYDLYDLLNYTTVPKHMIHKEMLANTIYINVK